MTEIPNVTLDSRSDTILASPDKMVKVRDAFGVDSDMRSRRSARPTSGFPTSIRLMCSTPTRRWRSAPASLATGG